METIGVFCFKHCFTSPIFYAVASKNITDRQQRADNIQAPPAGRPPGSKVVPEYNSTSRSPRSYSSPPPPPPPPVKQLSMYSPVRPGTSGPRVREDCASAPWCFSDSSGSADSALLYNNSYEQIHGHPKPCGVDADYDGPNNLCGVVRPIPRTPDHDDGGGNLRVAYPNCNVCHGVAKDTGGGTNAPHPLDPYNPNRRSIDFSAASNQSHNYLEDDKDDEEDDVEYVSTSNNVHYANGRVVRKSPIYTNVAGVQSTAVAGAGGGDGGGDGGRVECSLSPIQCDVDDTPQPTPIINGMHSLTRPSVPPKSNHYAAVRLAQPSTVHRPLILDASYTQPTATTTTTTTTTATAAQASPHSSGDCSLFSTDVHASLRSLGDISPVNHREQSLSPVHSTNRLAQPLVQPLSLSNGQPHSLSNGQQHPLSNGQQHPLSRQPVTSTSHEETRAPSPGTIDPHHSPTSLDIYSRLRGHNNQEHGSLSAFTPVEGSGAVTTGVLGPQNLQEPHATSATIALITGKQEDHRSGQDCEPSSEMVCHISLISRLFV